MKIFDKFLNYFKSAYWYLKNYKQKMRILCFNNVGKLF